MTGRLILVGQVAGAFGVRGEVRITTYTDDASSMLSYRTLLRADGSAALTLIGGRTVKGGLIATAREIATPEQAQALRGLGLHVPREAFAAAGEDEYYLADLIGLTARALDGAVLGKVRAVNNFGAGDLLEIEPADGGPGWWAPFTKAVVPHVDLAAGELTIERPAES